MDLSLLSHETRHILEEHILILQVGKVQKQNKDFFAFLNWAPKCRSNRLHFLLFERRILPFQRKMEGGELERKR